MRLIEQISQYEKLEKQYEKQIKKFNSVLDETDDAGEIKVIARRINETEEKSRENFEDLARAKIELEQLKEKYAGAAAANTFYNVKDRLTEFFDNNVEGQRGSLITVIKNCYIFSPYLVIDTGSGLFVFDTDAKYKFDKDELLALDKEKIYKDHFIESFTSDKTVIDVTESIESKEQHIKKTIYKANEMTITEFKLSGQDRRFNQMAVESLFNRMGIKYDFSGHVNVLFFMDL